MGSPVGALEVVICFSAVSKAWIVAAVSGVGWGAGPVRGVPWPCFPGLLPIALGAVWVLECSARPGLCLALPVPSTALAPNLTVGESPVFPGSPYLTRGP